MMTFPRIVIMLQIFIAAGILPKTASHFSASRSSRRRKDRAGAAVPTTAAFRHGANLSLSQQA